MTIHALCVLSVWIHILAAVAWIGGMLILVLVVVPWLRRDDSGRAAVFLRETGVRFRLVGWTCFAILTVTGTFQLWTRGVRLHDFANPDWLGSPFGKTVVLKLSVFAVVLVVSVIHDFVLGPRAAIAIGTDPDSVAARRLRRAASHLGRLNAVLAVIIVFLAVSMTRGLPW